MLGMEDDLFFGMPFFQVQSVSFREAISWDLVSPHNMSYKDPSVPGSAAGRENEV